MINYLQWKPVNDRKGFRPPAGIEPGTIENGGKLKLAESFSLELYLLTLIDKGNKDFIHLPFVNMCFFCIE